ncbi:MAG: hypothetical protein ACOX3R_00035 [Desulfitobacteriia bacterium]
MLSEIFYWVLNASILGSLAGLIVLGLRKIKALPRLVVYVLWALPLLRLWCPFGLANEYSLLSLISKITTKTVVLREEFPQFTTSNIIMKANSYFPLTYQTNLLEQVFQVASLVLGYHWRLRHPSHNYFILPIVKSIKSGRFASRQYL